MKHACKKKNFEIQKSEITNTESVVYLQPYIIVEKDCMQVRLLLIFLTKQKKL